MLRASLVVAGSLSSIALAACGAPPAPPPAPYDISSSTPRPIATGVPVGDEDRPLIAPRPPGPAPTGDHELDPLRLGFHGCRVMGTRIDPSMSGTAQLQVRLGPGGEVLDVAPIRIEGLPHTVVQCLVERVWNARFDPRGGYGSILTIPIDFTHQAPQPASPSPAAAPLPTKSI